MFLEELCFPSSESPMPTLNDNGIQYVDELHIAADQILHVQIAAPNRHAATFTTRRPLRCSRQMG
jgi:hypothetical protein